MNFKKTLSLVLAVLMVMTAVPLSGMATETTTCDHANVTITAIDGEQHLVKCSSCGDRSYEDCKGPAATTCGESPKCAKCNFVIGDPLPHNFEKEEIRDDNLASKGDCKTKKTYYKVCEVCGALPENLEGAATFEGALGDHSFTDYLPLGNATCTNPGDKKATCDVCKTATDIKPAEESAKLPHEFVIDSERRYEKTAPTCETEGEYYKICVNCSAKGTETFKTEKLKHVYVEVEDPEENATLKSAATCSEDAYYYRVCKLCNVSAKYLDGGQDEYYKVAGTKDAHREANKENVKKPTDLNLDEENFFLKEANCMNDAMYSYACVACKGPRANSLSEAKKLGRDFYYKEDSALNPYHNKFSDATLMEKLSTGKDGDCTTAAVPDKYRCLKNPECKDVVYEDYSPYKSKIELDNKGNKISLPLGHKITKEVPYKAPKCAVEGNYASKYCSGCNISFYFDVDNTAKGTGVGDTLKKIDSTGHKNNDGNDSCDICGAILKPSDTCNCICHKTSGIMYFVALILKFFWKLSGSNEYCKCTKGDFVVKHY